MPLSLIDTLKEKGHQVDHVKKLFKEASDIQIAKYAKKHKAILITKDIEFGSKIIYPKESHFGLIILRLPYYFTSKKIAYYLDKFLEEINPKQLINKRAILQLGRYRIREN
jgi:predicted nuclease of predicted toxin-antitoxin system